MQPYLLSEKNYDFSQWHFHFKEGSLSPSAIIDELAQKCILQRAPTIVFVDNIFFITHLKQKISFTFSAQVALRLINFEERNRCFALKNDPNSINYLPQRLQVKHAEKWQSIQAPKDVQISKVKQISDCFFLSPSKGSVKGTIKVQHSDESVIPLHKLGPQNEMKFYAQGSLYEDELDDNGLIQYEYKFRAMEESWFALVRCYARVDGMSVQVMDTRLYWQKGWNKVARQFMVKKSNWDELAKSNFNVANGWMLNPNQSHIVYPSLEEIFVENQYLHFE